MRLREVDAGLVIHESRFTYRALGLHSVADLGVPRLGVRVEQLHPGALTHDVDPALLGGVITKIGATGQRDDRCGQRDGPHVFGPRHLESVGPVVVERIRFENHGKF